MITRAVSTWSLHRTLGNAKGAGTTGPMPDPVSLLELPALLAARGYEAVQICHFHLPSRDRAYLDDLRNALADAAIALDAILVDAGDLTSPDDADGEEAFIGSWLETAAALGAARARISAGHAVPTPERIRDSAARLARLATAHPGVRVVTENWQGMIPDADTMLAYLDAAGDDVGLLIDLDNWSGPDKYEQLARIAPRAEDCHAKCRFTAAGPDRDDFRRTLRILVDAGYDGPLALIYDGPDNDEWTALDTEWQIVQEVFA